MHSPPPCRTGVGVDTLCQQRVVEPHPVAVDADDARVFDRFEQLDSARCRGSGGLREQVDGRIGNARRSEQHILDLAFHLTYPVAHQFSQRCG